jgi:ATP-dependent helicase HepA
MTEQFDFTVGQRFISQTEQELGLGSVEQINHRMVKLVFQAANEARVYAKDNAPITRIIFEKGDKIPSRDGWTLTVEDVKEFNGLVIYQGIDEKGNDVLLPETEIADSIKLDRPSERLLSGHLDSNKWFNLRQLAISKINEFQKNPLYGLLGCRTSLLKHQLYIAQEVAKRFSPRVLLADEVGLGKTIEAGLIIHQQLLKNRAKRVVVIVPESLTHQWMVEMLRRFNLHFSVYDEEQCLGIEESSEFETPFENSQLAIIPMQFLLKNAKRAEQLIQTQWDLLVVDEAHHIKWSIDNVSDEYHLVEKLANTIKGVLLLTATPEQMGKESHFARLRLLDSNRFSNFEEFVQGEENYQSIVNAIDVLRSKKPMTKTGAKNTAKVFTDDADIQLVQDIFEENLDEAQKQESKLQLVEKLLDQHGTGRLLFRNTRTAIKGFPKRKLHHYALNNCYEKAFDKDISLQLTPERIDNFPNWTKLDSRMPWLAEQLFSLKHKKFLLIAAHKQTVLDIADSLREKFGIHAAVFHEDMSLIERDRSAAWFADEEKGSQIMLCSEIGSEGRNFQFAHHLIFFDLPLNPDLLEQRIGRLDRIGQENIIHIHVPYLMDTAMEKLFHWYNKGLNIFESVNPAAHSIFRKQKEKLLSCLKTEDCEMDDLIQETKEMNKNLNQEFNKGRDRLLEYNSCRPFVADEMHEQALASEDTSCLRFMHRIFDRYGVDYEELRRNVEFIKPGESLKGYFPALIEDGMSVTFDRETALADETLHYLTWEHPMVVESMEMIATEEKGNACLISLSNTGLPPSTIIVESLFNFSTPAESHLQISRYLPTDSIRIVADEKLIDRSKALTIPAIQNNHSSVPLNIALQVVKMKQTEIKKVISAIETKIEKLQPEYIKQAQEKAESVLNKEIERLQTLAKRNPNVRESEIEYLQQQKQKTLKTLEQLQIQMNAVRVLVCL